MLLRPRLLLEPSGEPLFNLFLRHHSTRANVGEALRDFLLDVDVVLDVLERRVFRKLLKESYTSCFAVCTTTSGVSRVR